MGGNSAKAKVAEKRRSAQKTVNKRALNLSIVICPGFFQAVRKLLDRLHPFGIPDQKPRRRSTQTTHEPYKLLHFASPYKLRL
jgi:hypothetical protein